MKTHTRSVSRKFTLRPYRRIPTWYTAFYMTGHSIGKGVVMNLSLGGMRMLGDHALKPGAELTVRFAIDDTRPPVEIAKVSVRWAKNGELGLQFDQISPLASRHIVTVLNEQANAFREDL
ncbi:hypothetical protein W02_33690 [Nitrospira sp. KM1]|uniref:PilZ domain-containing protein n=1 Tax=Nitrospira sp. KM1 TaxID=1936990 RepID=UPI0013A752AE|nr:PilZ domain-containing protein [Nitrospira sp. KM1]BCA56229.1 hypothetical protein W02_33690 [Nitrospira sp. KM1]